MSYLAHSKRARVESYDNNGDSAGHPIDHSDRLLLHVRQLYLNRDLSDVEFHIGRDVVYAHKALISAAPKLVRLAGGTDKVKLDDTPLAAFKEVLRYLYTGRLPVADYEPQLLSEVRQLAEQYEMWPVAEALQEHEELEINLDNVVGLFSNSAIDSMTGKSCLSFIASNARDVFSTDEFYELDAQHVLAVLHRDDLSVDEKIVFDAAKRYVTGEGDSSLPEKKAVMSAVRFELLPYEYLWTNVRKFAEEHKLISIEELSGISAAKSKISACNPEIRNRAICLANSTDVVAVNTKNGLSSRVLRGKVADVGKEEESELELDLGLHYLLSTLGIILSNASKERFAFKLDVSVDRSVWETLYDFSEYHTSNKLDLAFDPRVIRYLRISNAIGYPDWAGSRKEARPVNKFHNIMAIYEEPSGLVRLKDHLLASKYLFQHMPCDFQYKSWFKAKGKYFYVCALHDPVICILPQPVWMESISLSFPDDKECNFTVEVTSSPEAPVVKSGGRQKDFNKGWLQVANYENELRSGTVDLSFEPTVVNAIRVTGTRVVSAGNEETKNSKNKDKDFAVEIRI